MILTPIIGALATLSVAIGFWQLWVALRFPWLRRQSPSGNAAPGITLLKPLKGCDSETAACLRSWFSQRYPGKFQILFGVSFLEDPAVEIVRGLLREFPDVDAELVHCSASLGTNAKISTLIQLGERAKHPLWCISDADVWAPPGYLADSSPLLDDPRVGLVNSFYRFANAENLGMRWEAFAVNADFWSQVLQSASLKRIDFALGAAMMLKAEALQASGGFAAIVDFLADDYHLGRQLSRKGWLITLSPLLVECRSGALTFTEVWQHQLRWSRTIRFCQPWPYFLSLASNITIWSLLLAMISGTASGAIVSGTFLLFRAIQGAWLERRLTGRWNATSPWMGWVKDLLQSIVWATAFTGNRVLWRGTTFRVQRDGKLRLVHLEGSSPLAWRRFKKPRPSTHLRAGS